MTRKVLDPERQPAKKRRSELGWLGALLLTPGILVPLGDANPAPLGQKKSERPVIERVEAIRSKLLAIQESADTQQGQYHLAQWYNWPNWPNWGNWGNWPNWGDWYNWGGQVPRRAGRWRWPGR